MDAILQALSGKRVLITGGLGFIGSNLAHTCLAAGAEVTIYDTLDPRSGGNMANIRPIESDIRVVINDIRNLEALCSAVLRQDILFNCAAYTSHPNSMKEPIIDIEVNCKGTINILEACRRFNPGVSLVHVGTSTQTGRMLDGLSVMNETHPEFPLDIYSANKSVSEKYVIIYAGAYGLRTSVVRLANAYGPRSRIKSPDFGVLNYFIGLALQGKDITLFGDGSQLRNITYVDDCVSALIAAAINEDSRGEIFFGVSSEHYSLADMAEAITAVFGANVRRVPWPADRQGIEIGDAVISNKKMQSRLGWTHRFDLHAGLEKTREYFSPAVLPLYLR